MSNMDEAYRSPGTDTEGDDEPSLFDLDADLAMEIVVIIFALRAIWEGAVGDYAHGTFALAWAILFKLYLNNRGDES